MSWTRPLSTNLGAWYQCNGFQDFSGQHVAADGGASNVASLPVESGETRFDHYWSWLARDGGSPGSLNISWTRRDGTVGTPGLNAGDGFTFCAHVRGYNSTASGAGQSMYVLSDAGTNHILQFIDHPSSPGTSVAAVNKDCYNPADRILSGDDVSAGGGGVTASVFGASPVITPSSVLPISGVATFNDILLTTMANAGTLSGSWRHIAITVSTGWVPVTAASFGTNNPVLDPSWDGTPINPSSEPYPVELTKYMVYRNGTLYSTNYFMDQAACHPWNIDQGGQWFLNGGMQGHGHPFAHAHMADIGIWNHALNDFEVSEIANVGISSAMATSAGAGGGSIVSPSAGAAEWVRDDDINDGSILDAANLMCTSPEPHRVNSTSVLTINDILSQWTAALSDDNIFEKSGYEGDPEFISSAKASFKRSINNIAHHHAVFTHVVAGYDKTWQSIARTAVEKHSITKDSEGKITGTTEGYKELAAPLTGLDMSVAICGASPGFTGGVNTIIEIVPAMGQPGDPPEISWITDPTVALWNAPLASDVEDGHIPYGAGLTAVVTPGTGAAAGQPSEPKNSQLGVWDITWTATDSDGNTSTMVQTITVQDTTAPVIILPGAITSINGVDIHDSILYNDAWVDPSYTWTDNSEADVAYSPSGPDPVFEYWGHDVVNNDGSGIWVTNATLDTSLVPAGSTSWTAANNYLYAPQVGDGGVLWRVTYEVSDHSDNTATAIRYVAISADNVAPLFNTQQANYSNSGPYELTAAHDNALWVAGNALLNDSGATITATDAVDGAVSITTTILHTEPAYLGGNTTTVASIDTSRIGVYNITLSAADAAGNISTLSKDVTVSDTVAPALTLNAGVGSVTMIEDQAYTVDTGISVSDISDSNPSNANTNIVTVEINDQSGSTAPIAGGPWDSSQPGDMTAMAQAVTTAITTAATNGAGDVTITYTTLDASSNAQSESKLITIEPFCCNVITQTDNNLPLNTDHRWYAGNALWVETSIDGPVTTDVWAYNQSQIGGGPGLPSTYGPIFEDTSVVDDGDYMALCFILDPADNCSAVGLGYHNSGGSGAGAPPQFWPFGTGWDGVTLPGTNLVAKEVTMQVLGGIVVASNNSGNEDGAVCCNDYWNWTYSPPGDINNPDPGAGSNCDPPCVYPDVCTDTGGGIFICYTPPQFVAPGDNDGGLSDKDLKTNIAFIPTPTLTEYHLIGLHTFEYDWAPVANDLFGLTGHVEEGFIAEQLEELFPALDPSNPPTSKEDGHIWWHEYMSDEQKALSSGVHAYYTFFNTELLEEKIAEAKSAIENG